MTLFYVNLDKRIPVILRKMMSDFRKTDLGPTTVF